MDRPPSPWGSPEVFRRLVRRAGLTMESLTAATAWTLFGSFSGIEFDVPREPESDGLLYQFGVYDFSGESRFHFDLTRQFGLRDSDEYLQFHCDLRYLAGAAASGAGITLGVVVPRRRETVAGVGRRGQPTCGMDRLGVGATDDSRGLLRRDLTWSVGLRAAGAPSSDGAATR